MNTIKIVGTTENAYLGFFAWKLGIKWSQNGHFQIFTTQYGPNWAVFGCPKIVPKLTNFFNFLTKIGFFGQKWPKNTEIRINTRYKCRFLGLLGEIWPKIGKFLSKMVKNLQFLPWKTIYINIIFQTLVNFFLNFGLIRWIIIKCWHLINN